MIQKVIQKRIIIFVTISVLILFSFNVIHAQVGEQGEPGDTWTCFGHDKRNSGLSEYNTFHIDGTITWTFETDSYIRTNPVMNKGTIYIGSDLGKIYAINEDGSLQWSYEPEGYPNLDLTSTICVGLDDKIYFGTGTEGYVDVFGENRLFILKDDGTMDWSYKADGGLVSSPVMDEDTLYIGSTNGTMYSFDIFEKVPKWKYSTKGEIISSPAVDEDGNIYFGNSNGKIYSINSKGEELWNYSVDKSPTSIRSSPCVYDGVIYIGANNGYIYSLNKDGSLNWKFKTDGGIKASPAVDRDGTIYIGSLDNHLYAISKDGELKWKYNTGGPIYTSAAVGSDGTVYFGSVDNCVYALKSNGELKWKHETSGDIYSSPSIGRNGRVYIGSMNDKLYAFGSSEDDDIPFAEVTYLISSIVILSIILWWKKR